MAKAPLQPGGNSTGQSFSTTPWFGPLGGPIGATVTVEAESQFRFAVAGKIAAPGFNTTTTAGTNRRVTVRKNGADVLVYQAPDGIAGCLFSTASAVAIAANDLVSLKADADASAGSATSLMATFAAASGHAFPLQVSSNGGIAIGVSAARSLSVHGTSLGHANGSVNGRMVVRVAGALQGAHCYVASNDRTTDVQLTLAVNNIDTGLVITVPAGGTGLFTAAGSEPVASGDDLAWRVTGSEAASILFASIGITLVAASGAKSDIFSRPTGTVNRAASASASYGAANGQLLLTTSEDQKQIAFGFPARASRFRGYITAAAYDATFTVRKNGVDTGLTFSVTAGASGFFEDASNSVDFAPTDLISYQVTGTGSGNVSIAYLGLTVEDLTPPPSVGSAAGQAMVLGVSIVPPPPPKSVAIAAGTALAIGKTLAPPPQDIASRPRHRIVTAELTGAINAAGETRTFYAADSRFVSQPSDAPANKAFDASLTDPGGIAISAFGDGRTGGATRLAMGELRLANINGQYDGWLSHAFDGRPVVLRRGKPGAYPGDMQTVFTGTVEALTVSRTHVIVRLRDKQLVFTRKALPNTYAGDNALPGGIEGTAGDIKGQSKPRLFGGPVRNIRPPCVNTVKQVYQISDTPIAEVISVSVDGAELSIGADYPDAASLLATTPTPGPTFDTCLAEGLFRLAADPAGGEVTCDATQGATSDQRTAAQVLRTLALLEIDPSEIATDDVAALDAANAAPVGLWLSGEETLAVAMDEVAGSVGAYYGFDAVGRFRMARLEAPVGIPVLSLEEYSILGAPERRPARDGDIPVWSYTVRHSRVWYEQSRFAGSVSAERRAFLENAYRAERAEAPEVRAQYLMAAEEVVDTLLVTEEAAALEAARRLELHKQRRDFFDVVVPDEVLAGTAPKLMDLVRLRHRRFNLSAGRLFRLLGIRPALAKGQTTLTLWG